MYFKCSQLADDTTVFLNDEQSIVNCISLFTRFEYACGLKLNKGKSNIIKVGRSRDVYVPSKSYNLKWPVEPFKALEQWICNDSIMMQEVNQKECMERIEKCLNKLSGLECSLKSKAYLIFSTH